MMKQNKALTSVVSYPERGQGGKKDGQNGKKEKQTDEKSQAADKKGRD